MSGGITWVFIIFQRTETFLTVELWDSPQTGTTDCACLNYHPVAPTPIIIKFRLKVHMNSSPDSLDPGPALWTVIDRAPTQHTSKSEAMQLAFRKDNSETIESRNILMSGDTYTFVYDPRFFIMSFTFFHNHDISCCLYNTTTPS